MNTSNVAVRNEVINTQRPTTKDQLMNHIEHGLVLTGVTFNKPVTKRLTIAQLTERLEWLRAYYKARSTKPQAPSAKARTPRAGDPWVAAEVIDGWLTGGNGADMLNDKQRAGIKHALDLVTTYSQA